MFFPFWYYQLFILDFLFFQSLNEKALAACEKFESKIDPFDLDVFQPYLQSNVKKSVYRLQASQSL